LLFAVAVAAVAVVVLAVALILSLHGGSARVATPPVSTVPAPGGGHHPAPNPPATSSSTTTSTTIAATPGGPPVIDSLSPSSGAAGQTVTITGANFLSSDGHIVAAFNGQVAPTSCPAQDTCTVTVPPSNGAPSAQVTVTTASGASNAVPFTYN
jgi:IPT/TIG domain